MNAGNENESHYDCTLQTTKSVVTIFITPPRQFPYHKIAKKFMKKISQPHILKWCHWNEFALTTFVNEFKSRSTNVKNTHCIFMIKVISST